MKRKKYLLLLLLAFVGMLSLIGCKKKKGKEDGVKYQVYFSNNDGTELVGVAYYAHSRTKEELVYELLADMDKEPESLKYKKIKSDKIQVTSINLGDNEQLTLHYNSAYSTLHGINEILYRAAVVKTLCQINGVGSVEFYVADQPLMESTDKAVGFQTSDDFIDNTGGKTNFYQDVKMNLYFSNEDGTKLVEIPVTVRYDGTVSLEQLVLERLIAGPDDIEKIDKKSVRKTIPDGTKVSKTSVREGVCYVYLNKDFLDKRADVSNEVAIYSVVNSLCELSEVNKVQFLIDGKTVAMYREKVPFDVLFERNLDVVQTNS